MGLKQRLFNPAKKAFSRESLLMIYKSAAEGEAAMAGLEENEPEDGDTDDI